MKPATREEMFFNAIAECAPCGLEPATREEMLLRKLAENNAKSWNDLTDKPFWDNSIVIENKEITEGAETDSSGMFQKLYDETIPKDLLSKMIMHKDNGETEVIVDELWLVKTDDLYLSEMGAVVYKDGATYGNFEFPSVGFYAPPIKDGFVNVLKYVVEDIHTIDPKYIVLTSPNGTKYNLSVSDDGALSAVET